MLLWTTKGTGASEGHEGEECLSWVSRGKDHEGPCVEWGAGRKRSNRSIRDGTRSKRCQQRLLRGWRNSLGRGSRAFWALCVPPPSSQTSPFCPLGLVSPASLPVVPDLLSLSPHANHLDPLALSCHPHTLQSFLQPRHSSSHATLQPRHSFCSEHARQSTACLSHRPESGHPASHSTNGTSSRRSSSLSQHTRLPTPSSSCTSMW